MRSWVAAGAVIALLVGLGLAGGCASTLPGKTTPALPAAEGWTTVSGVTFVGQEEQRDCGVAALAMVLGHWRPGVDEPAVRRLVGPTQAEKGVPAGTLRTIARRQGMNAFLIEGRFSDLEHEIGQGRPVLVGVAKVRGGRSYPHYEVVVGLNRRTGAVLLADPAAGWHEESRRVFDARWAVSRRLSLVVLEKEATLSQRLAPRQDTQDLQR